jgi:hypothetical protein
MFHPAGDYNQFTCSQEPLLVVHLDFDLTFQNIGALLLWMAVSGHDSIRIQIDNAYQHIFSPEGAGADTGSQFFVWSVSRVMVHMIISLPNFIRNKDKLTSLGQAGQFVIKAVGTDGIRSPHKTVHTQ